MPLQPIVLIGSAEWCDLRLPNMPPVAGVLYNCGSKVLFCDLTDRSRSPTVAIDSHTQIQLQGQAIDVEFSPWREETITNGWPEVEFSHGNWAQRRVLTTSITTVGSDYPSRFRLRGSSLRACHALMIWQNQALYLADLSGALPTERRLQEIPLGQIGVCHEIGIRFCGMVRSASQIASDSIRTQNRIEKMDAINATIVKKITDRSKRYQLTHRIAQVVILIPVMLMACFYGFRLLRLLAPHVFPSS